MTEHGIEWQAALTQALALANRLEGEGQYNNAKLLRAAADALARREAYQRQVPAAWADLAVELQEVVDDLAGLGADPDLLDAMRRGAGAMAERRLPLIDETPHPYVCRTCGHVTLVEPADPCPVCGGWPGTFQQFLPVYWLDALEPFAALARLRQTPREVAALLDGLLEDMITRLAADGGWSIYQALSHLRDAQGVLSFRVGLLLEEDNPALESKAVFEWADQAEDRPPTGQAIFDDYRASRQETLNRLATIPLSDWWRGGRHEEFGPVTLRQQVSYFATHELTHLPQMAALRRQWLGRES